MFWDDDDIGLLPTHLDVLPHEVDEQDEEGCHEDVDERGEEESYHGFLCLSWWR